MNEPIRFNLDQEGQKIIGQLQRQGMRFKSIISIVQDAEDGNALLAMSLSQKFTADAKTIKEQQELIKELQAMIKELEKKIKELEKDK